MGRHSSPSVTPAPAGKGPLLAVGGAVVAASGVVLLAALLWSGNDRASTIPAGNAAESRRSAPSPSEATGSEATGLETAGSEAAAAQPAGSPPTGGQDAATVTVTVTATPKPVNELDPGDRVFFNGMVVYFREWGPSQDFAVLSDTRRGDTYVVHTSELVPVQTR